MTLILGMIKYNNILYAIKKHYQMVIINLIMEYIQRNFTRDTHYYDATVKVRYTWYRTENVFKIKIN